MEFAEVETDMIARLGPPTKEDEIIKQNGYGATFHYARAAWKTPDVVAMVTDDRENVSKYVGTVLVYRCNVAVVRTADFEAYMANKEANRVDTLR